MEFSRTYKIFQPGERAAIPLVEAEAEEQVPLKNRRFKVLAKGAELPVEQVDRTRRRRVAPTPAKDGAQK